MEKPPREKPPSGGTNFRSCVVAMIFLIFVVIVILIVYFTIFKPQNLWISVNRIQIPSFSLNTNSNTVNFTFSQLTSVKNPNKFAFSHYNSSIQLLSSGSQIDFMFIPAGTIESGKTQKLNTSFVVKSFPLEGSPPPPPPPPPAAGMIPGPGLIDGVQRLGFGGPESGHPVAPTIEIVSRISMVGKILIPKFFNHHLETVSYCRVDISITDTSVVFHC